MEQTFDEYLVSARVAFCRAINEQEWDNALRTEAENILIAYDQMRDRLEVHVKSDAIEFGQWVAINRWKPSESSFEHWFKIEGNKPLHVTTIALYKLFTESKKK